MPKTRIFTIHRRADGKYETRNEHPGDSPLGVDSNLNMAIGSAHREAMLTAKAEGCRVIVMAENAKGKMEQVEIVEPPRARQ